MPGFFRRRRILRFSSGSLVFLACYAVLAAASAFAEEQYDWQGVERVVAVADLHGDFDNYLKVIQEAGLVDKRGKWIGGKTHFVQMGDVPDRGPDTGRIIEHLQKIEKQAKRAGGRVHALIGNHEAMNIIGDLRYVDPGEFAAFRSRASERLLNDYYERVVAYLESKPEPPVIDDAFREAWFADHPPGFIEHRQAWHPEGEYGRWVISHPVILRINRMLFVHGGLGAPYLPLSLEEINARVHEELRNPAPAEGRLIEAEDGPLWYRGLARHETPEEAEHVAALLERYDVDHVVVGHTPGYGTVVPRFGARVLAIDSGISAHYGGYRASLLAQNGKLFTVQRGQAVPIPTSSDGLLEYYRKIDGIEPEVNNLKAMIQRLERGEPEEEAEVEPDT